MQKIAYQRMGTWLSDAMNDYMAGFMNILPFGFAALGMMILQFVVTYCFAGVGAVFGVTGQFVGQGVGQLVGLVLTGIMMAMMTGAAIGRAHGRDARFEDARLDNSVYVQAVLLQLVASFLMLLVLVVAAVPAGAPLFFGIRNDNPLLIVAGVLLLLVFGVPLLLALVALIQFAMPLVVDRRLDFWSAITTSVDCVRRDLMGLVLFVILYGLIMVVVSLASCFTCYIGYGVFMMMPMMLMVRAYRDYFGLSEDRYPAAGPPGAGGLESPYPRQASLAPPVPAAGFDYSPPGGGQDPRLPPPPPPPG